MGSINVSERVLRRGDERILYDPQALPETPDGRWFDPGYWRAGGALVGVAAGRGAVQFVNHGERQWVLRHGHRGGLVGRLIADRYLYIGEARVRSFAEWRLLKHIGSLALPAPEPVAARYTRRGPWYWADLITCRLAHQETLARALAAAAFPANGMWRRIGRVIRRFHDAGVYHADLNAHNILLAVDAVYLVDFDRGAIRRDGSWKAANLRRLLRSLRKLTVEDRGPQLATGWSALVQAYAAASGPGG